jgi:hypothetical protein
MIRAFVNRYGTDQCVGTVIIQYEKKRRRSTREGTEHRKRENSQCVNEK